MGKLEIIYLLSNLPQQIRTQSGVLKKIILFLRALRGTPEICLNVHFYLSGYLVLFKNSILEFWPQPG